MIKRRKKTNQTISPTAIKGLLTPVINCNNPEWGPLATILKYVPYQPLMRNIARTSKIIHKCTYLSFKERMIYLGCDEIENIDVQLLIQYIDDRCINPLSARGYVLRVETFGRDDIIRHIIEQFRTQSQKMCVCDMEIGYHIRKANRIVKKHGDPAFISVLLDYKIKNNNTPETKFIIVWEPSKRGKYDVVVKPRDVPQCMCYNRFKENVMTKIKICIKEKNVELLKVLIGLECVDHIPLRPGYNLLNGAYDERVRIGLTRIFKNTKLFEIACIYVYLKTWGCDKVGTILNDVMSTLRDKVVIKEYIRECDTQFEKTGSVGFSIMMKNIHVMFPTYHTRLK